MVIAADGTNSKLRPYITPIKPFFDRVTAIEGAVCNSAVTVRGCTMLGDAAHLMPPYAGEGVNMAMLDALELSICLLNPDFESTRAAIAAYETQMRQRAAETAEMTMQSTNALHAPNAIQFLKDVIGQ